VGPYYREIRKSARCPILAALFPHWGKNERHTTVFPFFHRHKNNEWLLVNPLFLAANGGNESIATWAARYRGRTELDMVTPLPGVSRSGHRARPELLFPFF
jgi:hypothetical protein